MNATGVKEEVAATHWTPEHGPARNRCERCVHHLCRNRLSRVASYLSVITALCLALQFGIK